VLEDTRLASFTEKSTRYVVFDRDKFYREPRIAASRHAAVYEDTCCFLLDTYTGLMDPITAAIREETPRRERQTERAHEGACRAKACDVLRYILPAATLTNIGMTINGRLLEHLITKLLSHPLEECQRVGTVLKAESEQVIPTLIKYAGVSDYLRKTAHAMESVARAHLSGVTPAEAPAVALVRYPADAEDQLVSAVLYGYAAHPLRRSRRASGRSRRKRKPASSTSTLSGGARTISRFAP